MNAKSRVGGLAQVVHRSRLSTELFNMMVDRKVTQTCKQTKKRKSGYSELLKFGEQGCPFECQCPDLCPTSLRQPLLSQVHWASTKTMCMCEIGVAAALGTPHHSMHCVGRPNSAISGGHASQRLYCHTGMPVLLEHMVWSEPLSDQRVMDIRVSLQDAPSKFEGIVLEVVL